MLKGIIVSTLMALIMSLVMSYVLMGINVGFSQLTLIGWLRTFIISSAVGIPTAIIASPIAMKVANKIVKEN